MYPPTVWPIVVASIVSFIIGALWYSPLLFGKEWMSLTKMTQADMESAQAKGVWKLYIVQFIITLVTFAILGFFISATGAATASGGAFMALLAWIGFVATNALGGLLWEKKPFKLVLIGSISNLVCMVVGGAIIGGWM